MADDDKQLEQRLAEAREKQAADGGPPPEELAALLCDVANLKLRAGDGDGAHALLQEAYALRRDGIEAADAPAGSSGKGEGGGDGDEGGSGGSGAWDASGSDDWEPDVSNLKPAKDFLSGGGGGGGGDGDDDAWTLLDERAGLRFSTRGQLLSFAVPAAARALKSRRWRLRVLAARDPAAANAVQLASWEAFSPPGDGGGSSGSSGSTATVPFLTRAAIDALRAMGTAGAVQQQQQQQHQQDGGNGGNGDDDAAAARVLLRRIASNLLLPGPPDAKYFRLHAAKLGPLLARPHCVAALLAMGFRPLALASDGEGGTRAALVADASDAEACRAGAAAVMAALSASDGSDGVASS
jgi:hypothetical protein